MRHLLLTALLAVIAVPAFAVTSWNVNPAASKLTFAVPFNNQPVTGQFNKWDAKITFDPNNLDASSLFITVDLASVSTADTNRDTTLKGPDFFNIAASPTATYTSTRITKTSQGYVAQGNFTLGGITKVMPLPFSVTINGSKANAQGQARISRNAFGIGKGQWKDASEIADLVTVTFVVNADAASAAPAAK